MGQKYSQLPVFIDFSYTRDEFRKMEHHYENRDFNMSERELTLYHGINALMNSKYRNSKIYCEHNKHLFRHDNKNSTKDVIKLPVNLKRKNKFTKGYRKIASY